MMHTHPGGWGEGTALKLISCEPNYSCGEGNVLHAQGAALDPRAAELWAPRPPRDGRGVILQHVCPG